MATQLEREALAVVAEADKERMYGVFSIEDKLEEDAESVSDDEIDENAPDRADLLQFLADTELDGENPVVRGTPGFNNAVLIPTSVIIRTCPLFGHY